MLVEHVNVLLPPSPPAEEAPLTPRGWPDPPSAEVVAAAVAVLPLPPPTEAAYPAEAGHPAEATYLADPIYPAEAGHPAEAGQPTDQNDPANPTDPADSASSSVKPSIDRAVSMVAAATVDAHVTEDTHAKATELRKQGTALMKANDLAGAIEAYTRCIDLEPQEPTHFLNRSLVCRTCCVCFDSFRVLPS